MKNIKILIKLIKKDGQSVVVDDTNYDAKTRAGIIQIAKKVCIKLFSIFF